MQLQDTKLYICDVYINIYMVYIHIFCLDPSNLWSHINKSLFDHRLLAHVCHMSKLKKSQAKSQADTSSIAVSVPCVVWS